MRVLVVALAVLAALKLWTNDSLFRAATEQALLEAYRDRAVVACHRDVQTDARGQPLAAMPVDWSRSDTVKLVIGNKDVDVRVWQVDHALWDARYKNPYLYLKVKHPHWPAVCAYDVLSDTAVLANL